jgi:hypothetical protein
VLVRRAHRELVHVGLAEEDGPDVAQPLRDVGVVRGDVALEDSRPGGALAALDRDEVLEGDRDAEQRMEPLDRIAALALRGGQPGVRGIRLLEGGRAIDRKPGVQGVVVPLGGLQVRLRELAGAHLA